MAAQVPLYLLTLLGVATKGPGKSKIEYALQSWDWEGMGERIIKKNKGASLSVDLIAKQISDALYKVVKSGDWNPFDDVFTSEEGRVALIHRGSHSSLYAGQLDDSTVRVEIPNRNEVVFECEFSGSDADPENPDEMANVDHTLDDEVSRIYGNTFHVHHDIRKDGGYTGSWYFIHSYRFKVKYDPVPHLQAAFGTLIQQLAHKGAQKALDDVAG